MGTGGFFGDNYTLLTLFSVLLITAEYSDK